MLICNKNNKILFIKISRKVYRGLNSNWRFNFEVYMLVQSGSGKKFNRSFCKNK